jgi:uracil-DNA glycosylase family 4
VIAASPPGAPEEPKKTCALCPRLVAYRGENRRHDSGWHNAPVPSFGSIDAHLLIVGLAPGRMGANRTGRPFTGDYAGKLLYGTLLACGFARGSYAERPDDGLELIDARITNAVRCAPPGNRPLPAEIAACGGFLAAEIAAMPNIAGILALGQIAHNAVLVALGQKRSRFAFAHGMNHDIGGGRILVDSYHCSRLNTNTGRLTDAMFANVVRTLKEHIGKMQRPVQKPL